MVRGGKFGSNRNFRKTAKSWDCSDDSDEDYVVSDGEEESDVAEDALDDLDGSALEEEIELAGEDEEYEVDEEDEEVKEPVKWKAKPSTSVQRKSGGAGNLRKRKIASSEEDEDFDIDEDDIIEEEDDDDDDEEFTPEEDEFSDDEDSPWKMRTRRKLNSRRKSGRTRSRKKISTRGRKRRKKSMSSKNHSRKIGKEDRHVKRKPKSDDDADFEDEDEVMRAPRRKNLGQRKRRFVADSESDFVNSGQSDYEYTISEEEREQLKEASEFCRTSEPAVRTSSKRIKNGGNLSLRGSTCSKKMAKDGDLGQQRKSLGQKGKEKLEEIKVAKQVCGICLSEEDKRRVRGTLDCCSHYFCFTCIIQWSKVESRCPLCKQRFRTLSKPARSTGVDVRDVVISVPERDQVYQPTEEEIRGFLDPYENVICTECNQGGDDGLMLLCDLCDSPAHTYCVGLGREVPDGNWYCDGCRPVALGSSSSQAQDTLAHPRTSMNLSLRPSPISNVRESLDLNVAPSPRSPTSPGFGNLPSPGFPGGMFQTTPPVLGMGAPTLSGRRLIHRQIQQILSGNRMSPLVGRADGFLSSNLRSEQLHSPGEQHRQIAAQQPREREVRVPYNSHFGVRLQENLSQTVQSRDNFYSRPTNMRRQDNVESSVPVNANIGFLLNGLAGMNSMPVQEQLNQYGSRSSIGSDCSVSPCAVKEEGNFYRAKEQLQSMVRTHLKDLSGNMELGHSEIKDIVRSSTHTILAACGLEHRRSEVRVVPPPATCSHVERIGAGQTSLMKGHCTSCFDIFVRNAVQNIMNIRLPEWLSLGL